MLFYVVFLTLFAQSSDGTDYPVYGEVDDDDIIAPKPPNIIFIMADDLGWNDVSFRGSNQIPTPNIDALAYNGIILNNYYVLPVCTPSRSAFMTGKHPIHNGMQHRVLFGLERRGLPLNEKLLPQHLQELGYSTHMVGKWHLGFFKKAYTPTFRGFETHTGFWTGHQDYYDHTAEEEGIWGLDMRQGMKPAWHLHGEYSTRVFTKEAIKVIKSFNSSKPLFLYVAHAAVHSGNKYNPLPAPDETVDRLQYIENTNRRRFAAMVTELDMSVGQIVAALKDAQMLENSIIVFSTDNGGPANGLNLNSASNWPLRGVKNTLWEGGVRGVGILWSLKIKNPTRVSNQTMHICDWLPTLYAAAGGYIEDLGKNLDGYNLWDALTEDLPSPRKEILHNIDDIFGNAALTLNEWKLVKGTTYNGYYDGWYGPSGLERNYSYYAGQVLGSLVNRAISTVQTPLNPPAIKEVRKQATTDCGRSIFTNEGRFSNCLPLRAPCLFNITDDPCEMDNVADSYPLILAAMEKRLAFWNKTAVPPAKVVNDPRGHPKYWSNTWTNFGDYLHKKP